MGTSIPERHAPALGERWGEDKPLSACPFPQQAEGIKALLRLYEGSIKALLRLY
jgi:hypothetical protein